MVAGLLRQHQHHAAVIPAQQLAVEQIRFDRILHAYRLRGHLNRHKSRHPFAQRGQQLFLMGKRLLVAEQHLTVGNGNDVVMKHALVDHLRILLGKNHLRRINLVQPRNRLACG